MFFGADMDTVLSLLTVIAIALIVIAVGDEGKKQEIERKRAMHEEARNNPVYVRPWSSNPLKRPL